MRGKDVNDVQENKDSGEMYHSCFNSRVMLPNYVRTVKAEQIRNLSFICSSRWCSFVMNLGHKMRNEIQVVEEISLSVEVCGP
jgi:hypothetical protein